MTVPTAPDEPSRRLTDGQWRLRHSAWTAGPLLGVGLLTWASFLYVGFVAGRRRWQLAGLGYAVALAALVTVGVLTDPAPGHVDPVALSLLALWFLGGLHAVIANRSWLRWRAGA